MRIAFRTPVESLEGRRLLTSYTLDASRSSSPITVTATLDGRSLDQTGGGDAFLDGTSIVSSTRTGVSFSDNGTTGAAIGNAGGIGIGTGTGTNVNAGLHIVNSSDQSVQFNFDAGDGSGEVSVSNVVFGFQSGRVRVRSSRFSTRSISATLDDGTLGISGVALPASLGGAGGNVDASNGRLRQSPSSLRVTVPFDYTISTQVDRLGRSETLDITFSGTFVGVGVSAQTNAGGGIVGSSASGIIVSPFSPGTSSITVDRPVNDIFG